MYRIDGHGGLDPVLTPPDNCGKEYHCPNPNCGAVADTYYELNGEIIGCEHCIKMRWYYEIEEEGAGG